jgi:hypothetical protein
MKIGKAGENFSVESPWCGSQIPGGHVRAAAAGDSECAIRIQTG